MLKGRFILVCVTVFLAAGTVFCMAILYGNSSRNAPERSCTSKTIMISRDTQAINSGPNSNSKTDKIKPPAQLQPVKKISPQPTLNDSVIDGVKKLLLFVGHERSCHSFIGSLIDAHPHMILAPGYNPLWKHYVQPQSFPTKKEFFNILADYAGRHGARYRAEAKGYSLIVDPHYQGIFEGDLEVIGSQRADTVSNLYRRTPENFETLISHIKEIVGIPIYFIRVIRNPYDNIATGAIFADPAVSTERFVELKKQQLAGTLEARCKVDKTMLKRFAADYFSLMEATLGVLNTSDKYLDVHCDRLIANPKEIISSMCKFLEVECSKDYIEICASKVFAKESSTRKVVEWPSDILQYIKTAASKFPNLSYYIDAGVD